MLNNYQDKFKPLNWQVEPLDYTGPVMRLIGEPGVGKSRLAAEKVNAFCLKYPGAKAAIITHDSARMFGGMMSQRIISTESIDDYSRKSRILKYKNGSSIQFIVPDGHMDSDIDIAWVENSSDINSTLWDTLRKQMRGRIAHWNQIIIEQRNGYAGLHFGGRVFYAPGYQDD